MDYVDKMFQFGIRGISSSKKEDVDAARAYGSEILSPRQMRKMGIDAVLDLIPEGENYYITIDIDGLRSYHWRQVRAHHLRVDCTMMK